MSGVIKLTFNGVLQPDWLMITKAPLAVMPPRSGRYLSAPGVDGVYPQGQDFGPRALPYEVAIFADSKEDVLRKVEQLAAWLYTEEPAVLQRSDEPGRHYIAEFTDSSELDRIIDTAQGSITFFAPKPFKYGATQSPAVTQETASINNLGTYKTFPLVKFTANTNLTHLQYAKGGEVVLVGKPESVEDSAPVSPLTSVLTDELSTTTGWTSGSTIIEGGAISGAMVSEGGAFKSNNYGTGTAWHGPALKKSLPAPLTDFRVDAYIDFRSGLANVGRAEIYLMDANGAIIGKMGIKDMWGAAEKTSLEFRAGNLSTGKYIYTGEPSPGSYTAFNGVLRIERSGKTWRIYAAKIASNGRHFRFAQAEFEDVNEQYAAQLAQVQIHVAAYGTKTVLTTNAVKKIEVFRENDLTAVNSAYIAKAGDIVEVDHETKRVYLNGEFRNDLLNMGSRLFPLDPGANSLSFSQSANASITVDYTERYL